MASLTPSTTRPLRIKARRLKRKANAVATPETAATGMGLFGVGLGLIELLAARKLTGMLGVRGHEPFVRAMGLREIASGAVIAADRRRGTWSRVAGDALDIAALAAAFGGSNRKRRIGIALGAVAGAAVLDLLTARALERRAAT